MSVDSLSELADSFAGERIFLVGNGPSLNETPLRHLDSEYTFGVNKIYKTFDSTDWRPDFYFAIFGPYYIERWDHGEGVEQIRAMAEGGVKCFLNAALESVVGTHENIKYITRFSLHSDYVPFHKYDVKDIETLPLDHLYEYWSDDVSNVVYEYHSMYCMMQIAAYLGFDEVYLLGCDLGFEYVNPHMLFEHGLDPFRYDDGKTAYLRDAFGERVFFRSLVNALAFKLISSTSNYNAILRRLLPTSRSDHFDADYWDDRLKIQDGPSLEQELIKAHVAARRILTNEGIDVYNATLGGELDVYERRDLETLL
jgi:hypothetical protein